MSSKFEQQESTNIFERSVSEPKTGKTSTEEIENPPQSNNFKEITDQFEREKTRAREEVDRVRAEIDKSRKLGQVGSVLNWEIRLRKAADILEAYEGATAVMGTPSGEHVLSKIHDFALLRERQAQNDLNTNNNAETGKVESLDYVNEDEEGTNASFFDTTIRLNDMPVLTEVINIDKLPTLTDVIDKNEIPTLTRVVREDTLNRTNPQLSKPSADNGKSQQREQPRASGAIRRNEARSDLKMRTENLSSNQEALVRRIDNYFTEMQEAINVRAEKASVITKVLDKVTSAWNMIPLGLKLTVSELITSTSKQIASKIESLQTNTEGLRQVALAVGLSVVVAGFLSGDAHHNTVNQQINKLESTITSHEHAHATHIGARKSLVGMKKAEATNIYTQTAQAGDSVWKMTKHQLQSHLGVQFAGLSTEQQTYVIDAVKDRIGAHPSLFGLTDINKVNIGQKIDFKTILEDKGFIEKTITRAQNLTPGQISSIRNYHK